MSKTYYKVTDENLQSAMSHMLHSDLVVSYSVGKWTRPKIVGTKLMVFDNYNNINCKGLFKIIWRVEVEKPSKNGFFVNGIWCREETPMSIFWEKLRLKLKKKKYTPDIPPKGTVFCSAVKLIERVY